MYFKKIVLILFLIIIPFDSLIAQVANTGFVSGNIWYSKTDLVEGDKIKIHTFVFNPDAREFSGTVIFFDKTILLGKKDFIISGKNAEDISIDWTVTAGDHTIFAKIENAKFLISKGKYEEVYLAENETEKSEIKISKKIISELMDTNIKENISESISNISNTIENNTPDFIAEPVIKTTNNLEEFRDNISTSSNNKKNEIKKEVELLNKNTKKEETAKDKILKPFKYIEIFILGVISFIFGSKVLFYSLLVLLLFWLVRLIWKSFVK